jgi:hypothetical protein
MVKKKDNNTHIESKKYRITCERSLNDDNTAEILVYEYLENELISSNSDSSDTECNSEDDTHVHVVVIPPDSSPLYHTLPSPFTKKVSINVVVQSCESIMAFVELFCTPEFYQHTVDRKK